MNRPISIRTRSGRRRCSTSTARVFASGAAHAGEPGRPRVRDHQCLVGGRFLRFQPRGIIPGFGSGDTDTGHRIAPDYTSYLALTGTPSQLLDELELRAVRRLPEPGAEDADRAGSGQDPREWQPIGPEPGTALYGALADHQFSRLLGAEMRPTCVRQFAVKRMKRRDFLRLLAPSPPSR